MTAPATAQALRSLLPPDRGRPVEAYALDGAVPALGLRPRDREEVARVLEAASAAGAAVAPWGAGTARRLGRPLARYDVALDLCGLDRIVAYEPEDLTVTVEAGVTLAALQARLAEHGQYLSVDPPPGDEVTIGGLLATARPGAWRGHLPNQRDLVLGVTVALAEGTLTTSGGRVVKNVSGYDLHRLHTGALGCLGVIVEASFKLAPLPEVTSSLAVRCTQLAQAEAIAFDLWDRGLATRALALLAPAASRAAGLLEAPHVLVEFAGAAPAVERSLRELHDVAALGHAVGADEVGVEAWSRLRRLAAGDGAADGVVLRLGVPPSRVAAAVEASAPHGAAWGHVAAGAVLVQAAALEAATVLELRALAAAEGGHLQIEAAPASLRRAVDPFAPGEVELARALKREFDPAGLLNPGRRGEGL